MPFLRYQTSPSFLSPTVSWSSQYRYSLPPPPPPTSGSTGWACVWLNWMLSCDLIDKLFLYLLNLRDMDLYWWRNVVFVGKIWIVAKMNLSFEKMEIWLMCDWLSHRKSYLRAKGCPTRVRSFRDAHTSYYGNTLPWLHPSIEVWISIFIWICLKI